MNRIYKVIFSREKGMLVVASELAKAIGKSGTKLVVTMIASLAIFATSGAINIASAQIVVSGDSLNITGSGTVGGDLSVTGKTTTGELEAGASTLGATTVGSLDASNGGITNAGAISGATTITASDKITGKGVDAGAGQIVGTGGVNVSGASTLGTTTVDYQRRGHFRK